MMSFALYECWSAKSEKLLCSVGLKFTENQSCSSHFGRIETTLFYKTPESHFQKLHRQFNIQSWYKTPDGDYHMGITRFSLPPSLQGLGLGTIIWSQIFKGIPDSIKGILQISGSLNSGDAFTPQTGIDGNILYETVNGIRKIKLINQIERRNRFWGSMIAPIDKNSIPLTCDNAGNGSFKGIFKDPLSSSSRKISLKLVKS